MTQLDLIFRAMRIYNVEETGQKLKNLSPVAICMATDAGYAFPTAIVAKSIAQRQYPNIGPIYFIWADNEKPPPELIAFLGKNGITLVIAQNSLLRLMEPAHAGYLTAASATRLFLATILEKFSIDKFLYLDGDVEIARSLSPLAEIDLPDDHIAAVEDYKLFFSALDPKLFAAWKNRLHNLAMPEGAPYFNSGVILAHMQSWAKISAEAQKFHHANAAACISFDQCALNAVCHDKRLVLSPRWNFQPALFPLMVEASVDPGIVHFCGPYKPWAPVPFTRPWQARKPFLAARSELPQLWEKTALRGSLKHSLRLYKKMLKLRFKKKAPIDKERRFFLDYLSNTRFADRAEHF